MLKRKIFLYTNILFFIFIIFTLIFMFNDLVMAENNQHNKNDKIVSAIIENIDIKSRIIEIKSKKYYIGNDCEIILNEKKSSLKACLPIMSKFHHYAKLYLKNDEVYKVKCYYQFLEGTIKKVNKREGYIIIKEMSTPENKAAVSKFYIGEIVKDQDKRQELFNLSRLDSAKYIAAAVAENKLLYIFEVN